MLRQLRLLTVATATFTAVLNAPAKAQVTVGTANTASCYPFGCYALGPALGRYQQLYRSDAFSGALTFNTITFFSTVIPGGGIDIGVYSIRFATIASNMLGHSYDENLGGASATTFFDGALNSLSLDANDWNAGLSITGAEYTYDPTQENLLMDVDVIAQRGASPYLDADYGNPSLASVYWPTGETVPGQGVIAEGSGLVTMFSNTSAESVTTTPQPTSIVLIATGLVGVLGAARRKGKARDA